jgi:hypothetical protein
VPSDGGWDYGIGVTIDGHIFCIAEAFEVVGHGIKVPAEANARLIAAAPEMLVALKRALETMESQMCISIEGWDRTAAPWSAIGMARAAIAKATEPRP